MEREPSDGLIAIRPLRLEDAAAHLTGEDAETIRWLSDGVSDIAGTRRWIERSTHHWRDGGPTFVYGIWQMSPRTLVGMIEANTDHRQLDACPRTEPTFPTAPLPGAGPGYMRRALALLEGFLRDLGVGVAVIRGRSGKRSLVASAGPQRLRLPETITSSQGDQLAI